MRATAIKLHRSVSGQIKNCLHNFMPSILDSNFMHAKLTEGNEWHREWGKQRALIIDSWWEKILKIIALEFSHNLLQLHKAFFCVCMNSVIKNNLWLMHKNLQSSMLTKGALLWILWKNLFPCVYEKIFAIKKGITFLCRESLRILFKVWRTYR